LHWIESFFQIDPDGGSGSLELLIFLLVIVLVGACLTAFQRWRT
jgi:hypothetical protein